MDSSEDVQRLNQYLENNGILLVKSKIPARIKWLTDSFDHQVNIGAWMVFFNNSPDKSDPNLDSILATGH